MKKGLADIGLTDLFGKPVIEVSDLNAIISSKPAGLPLDVSESLDELQESLITIARIVNNKDFPIGVVGSYSAGKSSFVNALVGRRVLPVSAKACTAVITRIRYGNKDNVILKTVSGDREMTLDEFSEFISYSVTDLEEIERNGTVSRLTGVREAVIYLNSKFLKDNRICILDTPGLGASELDNKKTRDAMKEVIALIFLASEKGLSQKDKDLLKKFAKNSLSNLFIGINKTDLIPTRVEEEEILSLTQNFYNTLSLESKEPLAPVVEGKRVFPLSSRFELFAENVYDPDEDGIPKSGVDYSQRSGFRLFKQILQNYIAKSTSKARKDYIRAHFDAISQHNSSLLNVCESGLTSKIDEKKSELQKILKNLDTVDSRIALINAQYNSLESEFEMRYRTRLESWQRRVTEEWGHSLKRMKDEAEFDNATYLKLWKNDKYLFRSSVKKIKKAVGLLERTASVPSQYLRSLFDSELRQLSVEMIEVVRGGILKFMLLNEEDLDRQMILIWQNPNASLRDFSRHKMFDEHFMSVNWTVAVAMRESIKNRRSAFSVMGAGVHKLFRSEKNNKKRIIELLETGRIAGEEELMRQSDAIKALLCTEIKNGIGYFRSLTLRPLWLLRDELSRRTEALDRDIEALEFELAQERSYFQRIAAALDSKLPKTDLS